MVLSLRDDAQANAFESCHAVGHSNVIFWMAWKHPKYVDLWNGRWFSERSIRSGTIDTSWHVIALY